MFDQSESSRDSVGTSAAQFLKLGTHARAAAMGEAYSAVSDGSESVTWNPAGLVRVERRAFSFMHAAYIQNIAYDFASYACRIEPAGVFGIGFQYLNAGSVDRTDHFGNGIGTYKPYDLAVSLSWARMFRDFEDLDEEFAFGITGKFIQSKVVETAAGGAADLGFLWTPTQLDDFTFSAAAQNIGSSLKYKNESDSLPFNFKIGSAYLPKYNWILSLDVNLPNDAPIFASMGTEYKMEVTPNIALAGRGGYKTKTGSDIPGFSAISAGGGLGWKDYTLDMSWQPFGILGNSFLFSLSGKF